MSHPSNGEWNEGLWGCCSPCGTCCLAWWCPCCLHGRTSDRMRDPTMQTASTFNADCAISGALCFFAGCGWIWTMVKRGELRRQYGINGSMMGDCCVSYWCSCCASVQHDKEVVSRSGPVTQGYQPQPGMDMKPQQ